MTASAPSDDRPTSEQPVLADAIKHYNQNDILGDPMSVSLALGLLGWVVGAGGAQDPGGQDAGRLRDLTEESHTGAVLE